MRSHPSIKFKGDQILRRKSGYTEFLQYLDNIFEALPIDRNYNWRIRLFEQYFEDVYLTLKSLYEALDYERYVFWVVGNSLHGSNKTNGKKRELIPIATDILTAELATFVGFEVKDMLIARHLRRRNYDDNTNYFLRETVISLRK